jgi:hypothetical protein
VRWVLFEGGAPSGPRGEDWEELASTPKPDDFLGRLFSELGGIEELRLHVTEEWVIPGDERVATGFCGTAQVRYHLVETECLETKAVPYHVVIETYGLPGVEVHWQYCFDYAGQAGHAAFSHVSLKARFESQAAEDRFGRIWQSVFKTVPVWKPADAS